MSTDDGRGIAVMLRGGCRKGISLSDFWSNVFDSFNAVSTKVPEISRAIVLLICFSHDLHDYD